MSNGLKSFREKVINLLLMMSNKTRKVTKNIIFYVFEPLFSHKIKKFEMTI